MSLFYDLSNNSNKLRKSYVVGFVDISGDLLIRNDNTLEFYKEPAQTNPHYTMDTSGFKIYDVVNNEVSSSDFTSIDINKMKFLKDVDSDLNTRINNINNDLSNNITNINTDLNAQIATINNSISSIPDFLDTSNPSTFQSTVTINGNASFLSHIEQKSGYINQIA